MVESTALLKRHTRKGIEGSNPSLTAPLIIKGLRRNRWKVRTKVRTSPAGLRFSAPNTFAAARSAHSNTKMLPLPGFRFWALTPSLCRKGRKARGRETRGETITRAAGAKCQPLGAELVTSRARRVNWCPSLVASGRRVEHLCGARSARPAAQIVRKGTCEVSQTFWEGRARKGVDPLQPIGGA